VGTPRRQNQNHDDRRLHVLESRTDRQPRRRNRSIDYVATDQNGLTSTTIRTVIIEAPSISPLLSDDPIVNGVATA
jgi:hypothetical protein